MKEKYLRGLLVGLGIICLVVLAKLWYSQHSQRVEEGFRIPGLDGTSGKKTLEPYDPLTSGVACRPSDVNGSRIWYCDSIEAVKKLLQGPFFFQTTRTWLRDTDQVCIAEDKTDSPVYSCIDFTYYPDYDGRADLTYDYKDTCSSLMSTYRDLSGNTTKMENTYGTLKDQVGTTVGASQNYQQMIIDYKCSTKTSGPDKVACDAMRLGIEKMNRESGIAKDHFNRVQSPTQETQKTRAEAYDIAAGFKCRTATPLLSNTTAAKRVYPTIDINTIPIPAVRIPSL